MPGIAIDAYEGTGHVDWHQASGRGLVLGVCKVCEWREDHLLAQNWPQLAASGVCRGGYVYLHPSLPAGPQTARALSAVQAHGGFRPGDVLAHDLEISEGRSPGQVLSFVKDAVLDVRKAKPQLEQWIYSYESFLRWLGVKAGQSELFGCRLWVADYGGTPSEAWIAHQYTSSGTFPGLPGRGDLSQLHATTPAALKSLTNHHPLAKKPVSVTPVKPARLPVLPPKAWAWLRYTFLPAHYRGQLIASAWRRLSSNPRAARAIVARYDPRDL
jgi:GH25 family lysozyme M1 (1,4-beta-N-acetylmuramidase)